MRNGFTNAIHRYIAIGAAGILAGSCIEPSGPSTRVIEPRVVFASTRDANEEIYSMNSDGSNQVRLTNHIARDTRPIWSPDGRFIAFVSERTGNRDIFIMNADGTGLRNITADPANDDTPTWSPDGLRLAFSSNRLGSFELFIMDSDGAGVRRLTDHFAADAWPTFSPDGRYIAFQANRNSVNDDIYVLRNQTSEVFRMTTTGGADQSPAWSPDGTKIAFTSVRDGNFEIYTMNFVESGGTTAGPNQVNLTNDPGSDGRPSWSQNGRQICWMSNRAGSNDIWMMNIDGSNPTRLTTDLAADDFCSTK